MARTDRSSNDSLSGKGGAPACPEWLAEYLDTLFYVRRVDEVPVTFFPHWLFHRQLEVEWPSAEDVEGYDFEQHGHRGTLQRLMAHVDGARFWFKIAMACVRWTEARAREAERRLEETADATDATEFGDWINRSHMARLDCEGHLEVMLGMVAERTPELAVRLHNRAVLLLGGWPLFDGNVAASRPERVAEWGGYMLEAGVLVGELGGLMKMLWSEGGAPAVLPVHAEGHVMTFALAQRQQEIGRKVQSGGATPKNAHHKEWEAAWRSIRRKSPHSTVTWVDQEVARRFSRAAGSVGRARRQAKRAGNDWDDTKG